MKILVQKYFWDDGTPIPDANFFSDVAPIIQPQPLDLKEYLINEDSFIVSYAVENIDTSNFQLYIQSSNVTFQLTNLKEWDYGRAISDYFAVGYRGVSQREKYLVKIYGEDNQIFFMGIIYHDGVKFPNREQELLDVTVIGFEKEFKDYYQNKKLRDVSSVSIWGLTGFPSTNLQNAIGTNFNSSFLNLIISQKLAGFQMAMNPYMYTPHEAFYKYFICCRTGYNSFKREDCSIYNWLNSMALPMGWIWMFYLGDLHLKDRSDNNYPLLTLDYNDVAIEHSIENSIIDLGIDNVIIDDGEFYSNKHLLTPARGGNDNRLQYVGGKRKELYSLKNYYSNEMNPFKQLIFIPAGDRGTYEINYNNKTMIYLDEQNSTEHSSSRFREYSIYEPSPNITSNPYAYSNSLVLKPYIVSRDNACGLNITWARTPSPAPNYIGNGNFYVTDFPENDNDFRFTGHAGHSLYKYNYTPTILKHEHYYTYAKSETFKNNFKKFLRAGEEVLIKIKVKQLITNPLQIVKIINYPYGDYDNITFTIQSLSFDYYNEDSELTLMMN